MRGPSILLIEAGITSVTIGLAFCWPGVGSAFFEKLEKQFGALSKWRALSVVLCGAIACLMRLAILPLAPIPQPFIHDDFSFLLAADTFASGRLTNSTPPFWEHFESFHITLKPTYMSMYFPAQGLVLAAGKFVAGHPWYGVLASAVLMCSAICWALQAWLPASWALLGGVLAALRIALFSYWIDSYCGGAVPAIGGALLLGALPRLKRHLRYRDGVLLALGLAILALSRPFEGLLLAVPVLLSLCWWSSKKPHPPAGVVLRRLAPGMALLATTAGFLAYYDYRVFGNRLTPPYEINRATYASAPHFLWQSPRPQPAYHHKVMRDFYSGWELRTFLKTRTWPGFVHAAWTKVVSMALFFSGVALLVPLTMLPWTLRDRRTRFVVLCAGIFLIGLATETWLIPHYVAPFTAGLYVLLLQSMRHLRVWRPGGQPYGLVMARAVPVICVAMTVVRLYAIPWGVDIEAPPELAWYGTKPLGLARARIQAQLEARPGQQLAMVRYTPAHAPFDDWVYNAADIAASKVVWAREMDPASDRNLIAYFKNRQVWLIEPDFEPARISRYCRQTGQWIPVNQVLTNIADNSSE